MDKIEVTQRAREAAFDAYMTCFETVPNHLWLQALLDGKHDGDETAQAFARFDRDILATRTDATPVAWMDLLANAYAAGAEDVHKAWIEGTASSEPDFGESASDYARSIDFPPATDVAALVEALKWFLTGDRDVSGQALIYDGHWEQIATRIDSARQALAPFTKGQP